MKSMNYVSIFASVFISILVSVFLLDKLKSSLAEMSEAFANEFREHAKLSENVSPKRILRVGYLLGILASTLLTHRAIHPLTSLPEIIATVILVAILIPIVVLFLSLFFSTSFYLISSMADILLYMFWVPYKLYRDREHRSISQFRMFWFWIIFTSVSIFLVYQFMYLFWKCIS